MNAAERNHFVAVQVVGRFGVEAELAADDGRKSEHRPVVLLPGSGMAYRAPRAIGGVAARGHLKHLESPIGALAETDIAVCVRCRRRHGILSDHARREDALRVDHDL